MASIKSYECFKCRDNGFSNVHVYLAGKDEQGKTVYIEEDGTGHQHKVKQQSQQQEQQHQQQQSGSKTIVSESTQLKVLSARIEYAISLLQKLTEAAGIK